MKTKALFGVLAGMALLASCTNNSCDRGSKSDVAFDRLDCAAAYTLEGSGAQYATDSDLRIGARADLLVPSDLFGTEVTPLKQAIASAAFGSPTGLDSIKNYFHSQAADFGYHAREVALDEQQQKTMWQDSVFNAYDGNVSVSGAVANLTPSFLSYRIVNSTYSPRAAHGDYDVKYVNYDIAGGSVLTLNDIFTPEGLEQLPSAIARRANLMSGFIGDTEITALPSDGNFTVTADQKIVFIYEPYEVASFSQGVISVPFDLYRLEPLMTDRAKALFNL